MANATLTKAEQIARGEVGYREGPRNNETKFGAWFGTNFVAWCAIFMSWLSFFSGTTYLGKPWRFASTIAARDHAKKNKRWITVPTVGTVAMMAHTSTTGHVGWVIALLRNSAGGIDTVTIEGNTNDQGAREGNGVWIRRRAASSWDGYIVMDQTYLNDAEDDMTPDEHNMLQETRNIVGNLQAVANRDIDTLAPMIAEVLQAVKDDPSSGAGAGDVTPEDFVAALKAAL